MFSTKIKKIASTTLAAVLLFGSSIQTVNANKIENNKNNINNEIEIQVEVKIPTEEVGVNINTATPKENKKDEKLINESSKMEVKAEAIKQNKEKEVKKPEPIKQKAKPKPKKVSRGQQVANYAKKFNGGRYRYGGNSLTKGVDCSGFTTQVYKKFGVKLPRSSAAQRNVGKAVSLKNAKPGDLVCYSGHVAIYLGNNKVIHALNARSGIKITNINYSGKYRSIRRVL